MLLLNYIPMNLVSLVLSPVNQILKGEHSMFSFKTFKDVRYWILLIPYFLIIIGICVFASDYLGSNPIYTMSFLILYVGSFWSIYHLWKYFGDKRTKNIS